MDWILQSSDGFSLFTDRNNRLYKLVKEWDSAIRQKEPQSRLKNLILVIFMAEQKLIG